MTFESFLNGNILPFEKGENIEVSLYKLQNYEKYEIRKEDESYGVFKDGIEFLFEMSQLCLIQYDISRIIKIELGNYLIIEETLLKDFKQILQELKIHFKEEHKYEQRILTTSANVKIYFDEVTEKFLTAIYLF